MVSIKQIKPLTLAMCLSTLLMGCSGGVSGIRDNLGLNKDTPDEFSVVTRAPLEMPERLALPTPELGKQRPQEQAPIDMAKEAVLGIKKARDNDKSYSSSAAENSLLQQSGSNERNTKIRSEINQETKDLAKRNQTVVQKVLKVGENANKTSASVVDAQKELERINQNIESGNSILDGKTPIIEE